MRGLIATFQLGSKCRLPMSASTWLPSPVPSSKSSLRLLSTSADTESVDKVPNTEDSPSNQKETSASSTSSTTSNQLHTFAHLLRTCPHTQLGNPVGKVFVGRIYHVVNDDIYIDYGGKLPIVCQRTRNRRSEFVRGTLVRVMLKREEMSERFLGYERDMSLLEAEGVLLGLHRESRFS